MHRDQIFDEAQLPIKYVGLSHCFRTEAGAPGRDTRGLYRVHQFTKVEMFAFCTPEQSEAIHLELLASRRASSRGSACRTTSSTPAPATSAGRPIASTTSKPGCRAAATGGEYGEVTSTSNCTDFQARRLNIRYKTPGQKGTRFVHTLNGTAVAVHAGAWSRFWRTISRPTAACVIPEVLRPWVGKDQDWAEMTLNPTGERGCVSVPSGLRTRDADATSLARLAL